MESKTQKGYSPTNILLSTYSYITLYGRITFMYIKSFFIKYSFLSNNLWSDNILSFSYLF